MEERYIQSKNGIEKLQWVTETQMNHLKANARDVEKSELISNTTPKKVEVVGWSLELFCKRQEEARLRGEE